MAIEVLPPDLTRDDTAKQRFLQETKAASALDHPNICLQPRLMWPTLAAVVAALKTQRGVLAEPAS